MNNLPSHMQGILWMLCVAFCGSLIAVLSRMLTEEMHPFQIVCLSAFIGIILLIIRLRKKRIHELKCTRHKTYIQRAILEFILWSILYYAVTILPLPVFQALGYLNPLLLTTAAVIILGEKSNIYTWIALFLGIAGMLVVVRPGIEPYFVGSALMFIAMSCAATCGIIIKRLTATIEPVVIAFYMVFYTFLISLPFAIYKWQSFSLLSLFLVCILGTIAFLQQIAVAKAFSKADIVTLMPVSFMSLIFTSIFAYIWFDELVDIYTIIGAVIILYAAIYSTLKTSRTGI